MFPRCTQTSNDKCDEAIVPRKYGNASSGHEIEDWLGTKKGATGSVVLPLQGLISGLEFAKHRGPDRHIWPSKFQLRTLARSADAVLSRIHGAEQSEPTFCGLLRHMAICPPQLGTVTGTRPCQLAVACVEGVSLLFRSWF